MTTARKVSACCAIRVLARSEEPRRPFWLLKALTASRQRRPIPPADADLSTQVPLRTVNASYRSSFRYQYRLIFKYLPLKNRHGVFLLTLHLTVGRWNLTAFNRTSAQPYSYPTPKAPCCTKTLGARLSPSLLQTGQSTGNLGC